MLIYLKQKGGETGAIEGLTAACARWGVNPAELRKPVDEHTWQAAWDTTYCPSARAFRLLDGLDLNASRTAATAGGLLFQEGQYPWSNDRWVEAEDELTVSVLQARFNELRLQIHVRLGVVFKQIGFFRSCYVLEDVIGWAITSGHTIWQT